MYKVLLLIITVVTVISSISAQINVNTAGHDGTSFGATTYLFEDQIKEFVKKLSQKLETIDPYFLPEAQVNLDGKMGMVKFNSKEMLLRGFSDFSLTHVRISPITLKAEFTVEFKQIQITSPYYELNARAVFVPIYGSGALNLVSNKIYLGGSASVSLMGRIKDMDIQFGLYDSRLIITGLAYNEPFSDIFSAAVTECFPKFVNTNGARLGKLTGGLLKDFLNRIIENKNSRDLGELAPGSGNVSINGTSQLGPNHFSYLIRLNH